MSIPLPFSWNPLISILFIPALNYRMTNLCYSNQECATGVSSVLTTTASGWITAWGPATRATSSSTWWAWALWRGAWRCWLPTCCSMPCSAPGSWGHPTWTSRASGSRRGPCLSSRYGHVGLLSFVVLSPAPLYNIVIVGKVNCDMCRIDLKLGVGSKYSVLTNIFNY